MQETARLQIRSRARPKYRLTDIISRYRAVTDTGLGIEHQYFNGTNRTASNTIEYQKMSGIGI